MITPFKYAEYLATLKNMFGWTTSKIGGYESPPISEIKKWNLGRDFGTEVWNYAESTSKNKSKTMMKK